MSCNHSISDSNNPNFYRNSTHNWRALFDKALDAMLIADDQGCYIDANPAACKLLGLPKAELLGCHISQFSAPDFDFAVVWDHFLAQGELKGEFRLFCRDGTVRDTEFSATANFLPHCHLSILRDITESKQAKAALQYSKELAEANEQLKNEIRAKQLVEETLQKTQTFLSQIINALPDPVFVKNESHQWLTLNDACCQFIGIDRSKLIGKTDYDFFPKEEADVFWEKDNIVLNTGLPHENEESFTNSQGETRIILTKKSLLEDASSQKIIVGVIRDITERKLAETALRDSENRFRSMFEQAAVGTVIASLDGRFLQVNKKFCELVGYSDLELMNLTYVDITASEDQEKELIYWHSLIAGETSTYSLEKRYIRKDRSLVWVKVSVSLMDSSVGTQYAVGVVEDINNAKKSEEFLHYREEQFRALVENSPDIIARYDQELRYLYVNPAMEKLTGIPPNSFIGKRHQDLKMPINKCNLLNEAIQTVFLSKQEQIIEFDCTTANGLKFYQSRLVPEFTQQGIIGSVLSVSRDITQRKQAEEALQQAKQAADVANRAKSDFLTNISHELRTPLNGILGYTQILRQDNNLIDRQQNSLNIIYQCGTHLLMLIDDILDLSKIEAQKTELYLTEFYIESFLSHLVELFQMRSQQKGISFSYDFAPLPKIVVADEKRLRQVLINLLSNAVKFTDLGGVTFKVLLIDLEGNKLVKLKETSTNIRIRFQVEDTGIGINHNQLEEIFLPFCQVGERSHFIEGTGLGLAISQKLVQFMGTSIQVKSTVGQGSTFWFDFDLPRTLELGNLGFGKSPQLLGFRTNKPKVLIVDEHQVNRLLLRELLEPLGLIILEAINGEDCLNKGLEFQPNLILMDLAVPVSNSFETLKRLRALGLKDTIALALSSNTSQDIEQKSLTAGFQDFLYKPIQAKHLLKLIIKYLEIENLPKEQLCSTLIEPNLLSVPLVTPSASEIADLSQLAQIGDISGIISYAERLGKSDPKLVAFTTQTRLLAKGFKLKQLLEFLQQSKLS